MIIMLGVFIATILISLLLVMVFAYEPLRRRVFGSLGFGDPYAFTCRVFLDNCLQADETTDEFTVEMKGRIKVPHAGCQTNVCVEIFDVTEDPDDPRCVFSVDPQWQRDQKGTFLAVSGNGPVPVKNAVLGDYKTVAKVPCEVLRFPRRGHRRLLFIVSVVTAEQGRMLVHSGAEMGYLSELDGYMDLQDRCLDNLRAAVELALTVGEADADACDAVGKLVGRWLHGKPGGDVLIEELDRLLSGGDGVDMADVIAAPAKVDLACEQLCRYTAMAERLAVIELCLQAAAAVGKVDAEMIGLLRRITFGLDVSEKRVFEMSQKILPLQMYEGQDIEFVLGIHKDMNEQQVLKRLNEEYRKWNARVTHPNKAIRQQADHMMTLIADTRCKYSAKTETFKS